MAGEWEAAATFKFNIGDVVSHVTTAHHGATALRYVVVEQMLSRCHGGIQRHYSVSAVFQEGAFSRREHAMEVFRSQFNETELIAAAAPETELDRIERSLGELTSEVKRSGGNVKEKPAE